MRTGPEWGSVEVAVSASLRHRATSTTADLHFDLFQIRSQWKLVASVRQEYEVDIRALGHKTVSAINVDTLVGCEGPENGDYCVESLSAKIEFLKESGHKFKLQLIACC